MVSSRIFAYVTTFVLLVISGIHLAFYYPQLPDPMASHFDFSGQADNFMSKELFAVIYICMQLGFAVLFVSLGRFLYVVPHALINVPNKAYWLSDQRRSQTINTMETMLAWLGSSTLALMLIIFHLTCLVNLKQVKPSPMLLLAPGAAFSLITLVLVAITVSRFYTVPKDSANAR
jgi:uncharacterized membrane protein